MLPLQSTKEDTWSPLPPRVRRKHGAFYFVHRHQWMHLGRTASEARKRFRELAEQRGVPHVEMEFIKALHARAMSRAKRKRVEFTVSAEDVTELWQKSGGKCALTGIPFDQANSGRFARRPWVPSLDRIEAGKGYIPGNVRLICCAMNFALNAWGDTIFEKVAREFLKRQSGA